MQYSRELLVQMFKDGLLSYKIIMYYDVREKIDSLPVDKLSLKVKLVAQSMGVSRDTIYRALRMFSSI